MAGLYKLKLLKGFGAFASTLFWEDVIRTTLRGSVNITTDGDDTTYRDRWSGTEITVTERKDKLDSIFVKGNTTVDGNSKFKKLIDIDALSGRPGIDAVNERFESYFDQSGQGQDALVFFDDFDSRQLTRDVQKTPTPPFEVGATLTGGGGKDVFKLNDGTHFVTASAGNDKVLAGKGLDSVDYSDVATPGGNGITVTKGSGGKRKVEKGDGSVDTIDGVDQIFGTSRGDDISIGLGNGSSILYGQRGYDKLGGSKKADYLLGGQGNDRVEGGKGSDILIGGDGKDVVKGGRGSDILVAANGFGSNIEVRADKLVGGRGKDLFVIEDSLQSGSAVVIKDFDNGTDFIGLVGNASSQGLSRDDLIFDDLDFRTDSGDTVISVEGEDIAVLRNVKAGTIGRADFVEAFDLSFAPSVFYEEAFDTF